MNRISLRPLTIPNFGVPTEQPSIPAEVYEARCVEAWKRSACDWIAVYADREHLANIAFLSGFEPRFEEAILLLNQTRRIIITGNESVSYIPRAGLRNIEVLLSQSMSLAGQDRSRKPDLVAVLHEAGIRHGQTIGLAGWKPISNAEWSGEIPTFHASAFVVDSLRKAAGDVHAIKDATDVLMHAETGLRSVVDVHQIAMQEWGAARASAAVWRILSSAKPGDTELLAASRMGYAGEALNCHVMFASSRDGNGPVIGLASPTAQVLHEGDGVTTAVGYWGGLSSRAGLLAKENANFTEIAAAYFRGLLAWYETADIGVTGGELFERVTNTLAEGGLQSALNPGHLVGHDEWINSPVQPGAREKIRSGMPFQVDVIPTPIQDGWALNCEDSVTFADEALRDELRRIYPEVFGRIDARRNFMEKEIGVSLKASILPLSNTPLCLPPCWLSANNLLTLA
jgi:hypothetical protein